MTDLRANCSYNTLIALCFHSDVCSDCVVFESVTSVNNIMTVFWFVSLVPPPPILSSLSVQMERISDWC